MKKILAVDVETTGLSPERCAIVQLAAVMYYQGKEADHINLQLAPFEGAEIDEEALSVTGLNRLQIACFPEQNGQYLRFAAWLEKHIDKYNTRDKAYPLAYNGHFDLGFLQAFFARNGDNYLGSYINRKLLDPLAFLRFLDYEGVIALDSYKLGRVCEHFGIPLKAHDALADIRGAYRVWRRARALLGTKEQGQQEGGDGGAGGNGSGDRGVSWDSPFLSRLRDRFGVESTSEA